LIVDLFCYLNNIHYRAYSDSMGFVLVLSAGFCFVRYPVNGIEAGGAVSLSAVPGAVLFD